MSNMDDARVKAEKLVRSEGYMTGAGAKKIAENVVHKHEKVMHPNKKPTNFGKVSSGAVNRAQKFKCGGTVSGAESKSRLDKRARGGKNAKTAINIIVGAKPNAPAEAGMPPMNAPPPARPSVPLPMPAPAAPQAGMGAMPPQQPKPMMNKGGKVKGGYQATTGSGGGAERLRKAAHEKKKGF